MWMSPLFSADPPICLKFMRTLKWAQSLALSWQETQILLPVPSGTYVPVKDEKEQS